MRVLATSLVLLVALVACAQQDEETATVGTGTGAGLDAEGAAVTTGDTAGVEVEGAIDEKPLVTVPDGEPPGELLVSDLVTGDGAAVDPGDTVTTHYVGVSWSTGAEFDSSWERGQPVSFPLSGVIPGWTEGIPGMRVGGRRLLVIPPDLAYGDTPPAGAAISPGETLVFVIDLVETS